MPGSSPVVEVRLLFLKVFRSSDAVNYIGVEVSKHATVGKFKQDLWYPKRRSVRVEVERERKRGGERNMLFFCTDFIDGLFFKYVPEFGRGQRSCMGLSRHVTLQAAG